jgi:hypothetical protein
VTEAEGRTYLVEGIYGHDVFSVEGRYGKLCSDSPTVGASRFYYGIDGELAKNVERLDSEISLANFEIRR